MQYMGGKYYTAKKIGPILAHIRNGRPWIEPFCGSLWVTLTQDAPEYRLSDLHEGLICMYQAIQKGWVPPKHVSKDMYYTLKRKWDMANPLTAFAGFGCSFCGKFFGGYCGDRYFESPNTTCEISRNNAIKRIPLIVKSKFSHQSYIDLQLNNNDFVYCDPPYANTSGYNGLPAFESEKFWRWCREKSQLGADILISEFVAPADFVCIWTHRGARGMQRKSTKPHEKLFIHESRLRYNEKRHLLTFKCLEK